MEYELYIAGRKADLDENIDIALNYMAIDTDSPVSEHGSYSKSVELPGTANNNAIFGQMYDLTRSIFGDDPEAGGAYFDPRKRTEYVLWYNGDIQDKGYIKVDSVTNTDGDITYSCTLYSDLGNFFYNLCYNDEGEEITLADLNYNLKDVSGGTINENEDTLLFWDKDYIWQSWDSLLTMNTDPNDRRVNRYITAAPSYGGYYDDFDNAKVLVNYDSLPEGGTARTILSPVFSSQAATSSGYSAYKGWILTEATRDLDEWEVRDLRSVYQRPAIKMSMILDAISDPENNGGYEVVWDDDIKNSPYYKDTFLLLNRLNFELDENANSISGLGTQLPVVKCSNGVFQDGKLWDAANSASTIFNLSGYTYPHVTISMENYFTNVSAFEQVTSGKTIYTSYWCQYHAGRDLHHHRAWVYGGMAVRVSAYNGDTMKAQTPVYLYTTPVYNSNKPFGYGVDNWKWLMANQLQVEEGDIVVRENNIIWDNDRGQNKWAMPIEIDLNLPSEDNLTLYLQIAWVWVASRSDAGVGIAFQTSSADKGYMTRPYWNAIVVLLNDDEYSTGIYDGTINPNVQKTNVTKQILFGDTESPYKYLVGFTRMMGAKFMYDLAAKKIYIYSRKKYYLPEGHMIDDLIDRGQDIEVQPTLSEYKWCQYGFETPETYAAQLYNRKNKVEYGVKKIDTGYYFNNDTNNLFEDIPYTNGIPYLQNSIYYNVVSGVPSILVSPTLDVSIFKQSGDTVEDESVKIRAYSSYHSVSNAKDTSGDKICAFDDSNEAVEDLTNCLVFFDRNKTMLEDYQISDNIPIMATLNDNPCFMYVSGNTLCYADKDAVDKTEVCKKVSQVPVFSKYKTSADGVYEHSLDFMKPSYTFIGNDANYSDGICLYDRYWKAFISDLYERNAKAVTVRVFLYEKPDVAMRKFYFFDSSIWVISEITDYDASSVEPTQVKFVKVYDISDYIDGEVDWDKKYEIIEPEPAPSPSGCTGPKVILYLYASEEPEEYCFPNGIIPWGQFSGRTDVERAIIGSGITEIGGTAFWGCTNLTSVTIANTVTDINRGAFGSTSLTNIHIPNSVVTIEYGAFPGTLTGMTIGTGLQYFGKNGEEVGGSVFDCPSQIMEIHISATTAPTITQYTFSCVPSGGTLYYPCTSDYSTWFAALPDWIDPCYVPPTPSGVCVSGGTKILGDVTTYGATTSQTDYYEDGVIPINKYIGRTDIVSLNIGSGVTGIKQSAFADCTNLTSITIPDNVFELGLNVNGGIFRNCRNAKTITISDSVVEIGKSMFLHPKELETLHIGKCVKSIGKSAFECADISPNWACSSLTIPDAVVSISASAFTNWEGLKELTIGRSLTSIGSYCFDGCFNVTSITCYSTTAKARPNIPRAGATGGTLYVPYGSTGYDSWLDNLPSGWTISYITPPPAQGATMYYWNSGSTEENSEFFIDYQIPYQFQHEDRMKMEEVQFYRFKFIGYQAFQGTKLGSVFFSDDIISIGKHAFYNCRNLTTIIFYNSSSFPCKLRKLGDSAFAYCSSLTGVTIPDHTIREIPFWCFRYCTSLTSFNIPDGVNTIGESAFEYCTSLSSVNIPGTVTTIGDNAFAGCTNLESISLPCNLETIPTCLCTNCTNLVHVDFPTNLSGIGNSAFYGTGLSGVAIPDSVTYIGDDAFEYCTALSDLYIGSGVTRIGEYAFYGCSNLSTIVCYATTAPNLSAYDNNQTFHGVSSTGTLYVPYGSTGYYSWLDDKLPRGWTISYFGTPTPSGSTSGDTSLYTFQWEHPQYEPSPKILVFEPSSGGTFIESGGTNTIYQTFESSREYDGQKTYHIPYRISNNTGGIVNAIEIGQTGNMEYVNFSVLANPTAEYRYGSINFTQSDSGEIMRLDLHQSAGSGSTSGDTSGSTSGVCRGDAVLLHLTGGTDEIHSYSGTSTPNSAFSGRTDIESAEICYGITKIGSNTFSGCTNMTSVTISSSVTSIGHSVFRGCTSLTSLTIPSPVTKIGVLAFYGCTSLTSVTIPSSVTEIGTEVFDYCTSLTSITSYATTAPTFESTPFSNISTTGTLYVPTGSDYSSWMAQLPSGWTISYF